MLGVPINRAEFEIKDTGVLHNSRSIIFNIFEMNFYLEDPMVPETQKILLNWNNLQTNGILKSLTLKFGDMYGETLTKLNYLTSLCSTLITERKNFNSDKIPGIIEQASGDNILTGEDLEILNHSDPDVLILITSSYMNKYDRLLQIINLGRQMYGRKLTEILKMVCIAEGVNKEIIGGEIQADKGIPMVVDLLGLIVDDFMPYMDGLYLDGDKDLLMCFDMIDENSDANFVSCLTMKMVANELGK
jgi:hypothetical protein